MTDMHTDPQAATLAFLADPATHGGAPVERIDTHISAVFLAGDRAIKIKKAVTLPFLDFAPLQARRTACAAEVRLNRRTAPDLYLGTATITRQTDGTLAFDGTGEVVDEVVLMRRFDQAGRLDNVAARGDLNRHVLTDLAEAVAAFHDAAEPIHSMGGADDVRRVIDGNADSFAAFKGTVFDPALVDAVLERSRGVHALHAALLDRRQEKGLVRRCHGDLHLGNVVIHEGHPQLFDCIEFNDAFACIDVLYDLAFLLMDLQHGGHDRAAANVFNAYMDMRADIEGLPLLPLFLSMRAQIRAHVSAAIAVHAADPAPLHEAARAYLQRASAYLEPTAPRLIAIGGLSGSGKSRAARELAPFVGPAPAALVLRTDVIRKRLCGLHPTERLPAQAYTREVSDSTYAALLQQATQALAAGHAVIADAVFARPEERTAIEGVATIMNVPFTGLWLEADPAVAEARITNRTRNASDATPEVLRQQQTYSLGPMSWTTIDSSHAKDDTDRAVRAALIPSTTHSED